MKSKTIRVKITAEITITDHNDLSSAASSIEEAIDTLNSYGEAHLDSFVVD